jgi:hypothetical protein
LSSALLPSGVRGDGTFGTPSRSRSSSLAAAALGERGHAVEAARRERSSPRELLLHLGEVVDDVTQVEHGARV